MKKYFNLFWMLANNNLVREMEFRSNFLLTTINALAWTLYHVWMVTVYFSFTNNLFGWQQGEILIYVGIFRLIKSFFDFFPRVNLLNFPEAVSRGELDYSLTRPVNSLFLLSFRRFLYREISSIIGGLATFAYGLYLNSVQFSFFDYAELGVMVIVGLLAYCSIFLVISTLSIFTIRMTALGDINNVLANTIRYPSQILSRGSQAVEILILPLTVVATFPAQIFLKKSPQGFFFIEIISAFLLFFVAYKFWLFALRHYSSASS